MSLRNIPDGPRVLSYPPSDGPWTGANELGWEAPFRPDNDNTQRMIKMPEWGPPVRWTLSLGIEDELAVLPALQQFDVVAEVTIGAGGANQFFEVDWVRGTAISFVANAATVVARWTGNLNGDITGLRLSCTLARGDKGSAHPATRTILPADTSVVAGGAQGEWIRIPRFARQHWPQPVSNTAPALAALYDPAMIYEFAAQTSPVIVTVGAYPGNYYFSRGGVFIPRAARFVRIDNGTATAINALHQFAIEP